MINLKPAATAPTPCKICGAPAPQIGVVDFNRNCDIPNSTRLPPSGTLVHYRQCSSCGFMFTDSFDDWSQSDFKAHIYNDDYLGVDPDYVSVRPRGNAAAVQQLFGAQKADVRLLDYGGGNDVLCADLRAAGFAVAQTYDPFVADFARRPEGKFNLITCFETLEHMPDPMSGIADILASLDEPGLVLFSTLLQPQDIDRLGLSWWYVGPRNGHVSLFSRKALGLAWERHGYRVVSLNDNAHIAFRTLPLFAKRLGG
ncbi:MAG: class I SAM-dependent methyltransferase [Pseudolabrys sp.]